MRFCWWIPIESFVVCHCCSLLWGRKHTKPFLILEIHELCSFNLKSDVSTWEYLAGTWPVVLNGDSMSCSSCCFLSFFCSLSNCVLCTCRKRSLSAMKRNQEHTAFKNKIFKYFYKWLLFYSRGYSVSKQSVSVEWYGWVWETGISGNFTHSLHFECYIVLYNRIPNVYQCLVGF